MKVVPPYDVRVAQLDSNFSKAFPVKSNITGHNLLKTEIEIASSPAPVSNLHLTSTLGPILVPCVL